MQASAAMKPSPTTKFQGHGCQSVPNPQNKSLAGQSPHGAKIEALTTKLALASTAYIIGWIRGEMSRAGDEHIIFVKVSLAYRRSMFIAANLLQHLLSHAQSQISISSPDLPTPLVTFPTFGPPGLPGSPFELRSRRTGSHVDGLGSDKHSNQQQKALQFKVEVS